MFIHSEVWGFVCLSVVLFSVTVGRALPIESYLTTNELFRMEYEQIGFGRVF